MQEPRKADSWARRTGLDQPTIALEVLETAEHENGILPQDNSMARRSSVTARCFGIQLDV